MLDNFQRVNVLKFKPGTVEKNLSNIAPPAGNLFRKYCFLSETEFSTHDV